MEDEIGFYYARTEVRLLVRARRASLYSVGVAAPGETPVYHRFEEGNAQRNQVGRDVVMASLPAHRRGQ
jgi:hypothetical protein